jgi:hypothetical protein
VATLGQLQAEVLKTTLAGATDTVVNLSEEQKTAYFEKEIYPILEKNCFKCHRNDPHNLKAHLWLGSREGILKGGDVGPVVDLQTPANSYILKMINYVDKMHQMPPTGKLPDELIIKLTRWLHMGASFKKELERSMPKSEVVSTTQVNEHTRNYWCYKKLVRPEVPKVKKARWVTNAIDNFILARLEANGLQPNGPADKIALVRAPIMTSSACRLRHQKSLLSSKTIRLTLLKGRSTTCSSVRNTARNGAATGSTMSVTRRRTVTSAIQKNRSPGATVIT